ncbi:MAG: hypothetical protein HKO64_05105 [Xanthomonadales bacterium]|nr:hypothetical protein [Xanthomonadales bacterium]
MNWLEKNPVGIALAGFCAVLLMIAAAVAFTWSRPASSGADPSVSAGLVDTAVNSPSSDLGPISQYKLVTDRPLFEETRRPVVSVEVEGSGDGFEDQFVAGTPEVALSGVVITHEKSIVTLKPVNGGETIIAMEGQPLGEDYPGWAVSDIKPRKIVLASLEGDSVELDLAINTRPMTEPPKPEPSPAAQAEAGAESENEEPPLSRAEEIRQRIAQRREELRRQAEENEQDESQKMRSQYQDAIRNMIQRKDNNDETTKEGNDGNGN